MTELLKKNKSFDGTDNAQASFDILKQRLTSAPFLANPDFTKPFIIQCDASQNGVGAVLAQLNENGEEVPIAYMSQKPNKAQRNYSVTEQECLAAVLAVKKFRSYVEGQEFRIITDDASLRWLMNQADLSGRLARWALKLQAFQFSIEHRKGTQNVVPDVLSRAFEDSIASVSVDYEPDIDLSSPAFNETYYVELRNKIVLNKDKHPDFDVRENFIYHFISGDEARFLVETRCTSKLKGRSNL